jgi:hypothetical protein
MTENGIRLLTTGAAERYFAPLSEAYVRSGTLISTLPQDKDHAFGIGITQMVLVADEHKLVLETVVAVQTSFLDAHPTIDLVACGVDGEVHGLVERPSDSNPVSLQRVITQAQHPPAATRFIRSAHVGSAYLLLSPADRAAASRQADQADWTSYRLLSEFMEKGVIRKARFWTCVWAATPDLSHLQEAYNELIQQPLPLTP